MQIKQNVLLLAYRGNIEKLNTFRILLHSLHVMPAVSSRNLGVIVEEYFNVQ